MELVFDIFCDRKREIMAHLDLIRLHENSLSSKNISSTPEQYQILLACTYLLIYNMMEATIVKLLESLKQELDDNACPHSLTSKLKKEWLKSELGTSEQLTPENRLKKAMQLLEHLSGKNSFKMSIKKGGGGNWDDEEIHKLSFRLGIDLSKIPAKITEDIKRNIQNSMGAAKLVVYLRNQLAHGDISFCECGKDKDLNDIVQIFNCICAYIEEVAISFKEFVEEKRYIVTRS